MQGLFVNGGLRPQSKKQVKELVATRPELVYVESTSMFGNEYDGPAVDLPAGTKVFFVGPDPYTKRSFYGTLERTAKGLKVS